MQLVLPVLALNTLFGPVPTLVSKIHTVPLKADDAAIKESFRVRRRMNCIEADKLLNTLVSPSLVTLQTDMATEEEAVAAGSLQM